MSKTILQENQKTGLSLEEQQEILEQNLLMKEMANMKDEAYFRMNLIQGLNQIVLNLQSNRLELEKISQELSKANKEET